MSRYGGLPERVTTQAGMVAALEDRKRGGGEVLLEGGVFTIDQSTPIPAESFEVTLHLGDGASLEVRDGLAPRVSLTLPGEYLESLREAGSAPRSLYWSSATPPADLALPSQNPYRYGDMTLYVPEELWDLYFSELTGWSQDYPPRYALERWVGYGLRPGSPSKAQDYVREARKARQGGVTYALDEVESVHAPAHYTWLGNALAALGLLDARNVEAWDVLDAAFPSNPHLWNCGKYLLRQGRKGGEEKRLEDLRKARQYLERAIESLERGDRHGYHGG